MGGLLPKVDYVLREVEDFEDYVYRVPIFRALLRTVVYLLNRYVRISRWKFRQPTIRAVA